jgi:hypothetical protein
VKQLKKLAVLAPLAIIAAAFALYPNAPEGSDLKLSEVKTIGHWNSGLPENPRGYAMAFYRCREPWTVKNESVYFSEKEMRLVAMR